MKTCTKILFLTTLLAFLGCAPFAGADAVVADSVTTATGLAAEFNVRVRTELKDRPLADTRGIIDASEDANMSLNKELASIKWSVAPGPRRYKRVRGLLESYMDGVIASLKDRASTLNQPDRAGLEKIAEGLALVKDAKLKALEDSLKSETSVKEVEKPVPSTDKPRGESPPEGGATIWDR